jgi:LEA14-like dessication related protein
MIKNIQTLFKHSAFILLASIIASCSVLQKAIEKPKVHVEEVSFHPVSLKEGRLDSRMQISNPNGFALPVRNLTYHLKLNDRELVNSELAFDKNIPAKGALEIHVPIHFQYGELLNGISSILQHRNIRFQLAGELDLGLVKIPFSKTGEFVLKQ